MEDTVVTDPTVDDVEYDTKEEDETKVEDTTIVDEEVEVQTPEKEVDNLDEERAKLSSSPQTTDSYELVDEVNESEEEETKISTPVENDQDNEPQHLEVDEEETKSEDVHKTPVEESQSSVVSSLGGSHDKVLQKVDVVRKALSPAVAQLQNAGNIAFTEFSIVWPGPVSLVYKFLCSIGLILSGSLFYLLLALWETEKWCNIKKICCDFLANMKSAMTKKSDDGPEKKCCVNLDPKLLTAFFTKLTTALFTVFIVLRSNVARSIVLGVAVSSYIVPYLANLKPVAKNFNICGQRWQEPLLQMVSTAILVFVFVISGIGPRLHAAVVGAEMLKNCVLLAKNSKKTGSLQQHESLGRKRIIAVVGVFFGLFIFGLLCRYFFGAYLSIFPKVFGFPFYVADLAIYGFVGSY